MLYVSYLAIPEMNSDKGEVLSWGHGGHGQLGHSSLQNQKVPVRIEALANERVTYIACGGSSSAAITGKLIQYMFNANIIRWV